MAAREGNQLRRWTTTGDKHCILSSYTITEWVKITKAGIQTSTCQKFSNSIGRVKPYRYTILHLNHEPLNALIETSTNKQYRLNDERKILIKSTIVIETQSNVFFFKNALVTTMIISLELDAR